MVEYQELDDRQLIQQTALGMKEALEELYNRYSTPVFSLARFMLRHEALAEEATQDIFLVIAQPGSNREPAGARAL
ncbi:MAG: hypothetical protein O2860_10425 [Chloroflexi bacterium]|nr:hypothetical protein [Chloroflexota bacterium]